MVGSLCAGRGKHTALTNSFAGARYGFTRERRPRETEEEREREREGWLGRERGRRDRSRHASAREIEMLLMPGRAIGDKQK